MTQFRAPSSPATSISAGGRRPLVLGLLVTAACFSTPKDAPDAGGSGSGGPAAQMVDCTASVTKEIIAVKVDPMTNDYAPNPMNIPPGTTVRFKLQATPEHNARSSDGLFSIGFGQTECVKFNAPGTYQFGCTAHGFIGNVVVK
jgi:plastocyanin